jgi:two-component system CheB/CheR fusion protein
MDVSKCKEFGMDSYISKPIDEKLLYNKIVELVKEGITIDEKSTLQRLSINLSINSRL